MLYQLSYASLQPGSTRTRRPKHDSSCQPGQSLKLSRAALYVQTYRPSANYGGTNNSPLPRASWLGFCGARSSPRTPKCGRFILAQLPPGSPLRRLFSYHRVSPMRTRRKQLWVAFAVIVFIAGGILTAILLRKRAAPDAVRLLPDSDAVFYLNLEPVRLLTDLGKKPPKDRDPQYEEFVRETGFEFERDLDKAAFAIHYGTTTNGKS